jgi:hypothetical protein
MHVPFAGAAVAPVVGNRMIIKLANAKLDRYHITN